jgi:hypothetical protein
MHCYGSEYIVSIPWIDNEYIISIAMAVNA